MFDRESLTPAVADVIIDHLGFISIVKNAVNGDEERARDLIFQAISQIINIYEYSMIDSTLIGDDKEKFSQTLRANMEEDVTDDEFDAIKVWISCTSSKSMIDWAGSILNDKEEK